MFSISNSLNFKDSLYADQTLSLPQIGQVMNQFFRSGFRNQNSTTNLAKQLTLCTVKLTLIFRKVYPNEMIRLHRN